MTWKAMPPEEVLRILTFWNDAHWPLSEEQVNERAVTELGWTLDDENWLNDTVTELTSPDVMVSDNGHSVARISLGVTDVEREEDTPGWARWRNDRYTEIIRALTDSWGAPGHLGDEYRTARWEMPTQARVEIADLGNCLSAAFITPQAAQIDRKVGY
ncbi:MAG: DUF6301 family protein [Dermatophilaceae bacterium]